MIGFLNINKPTGLSSAQVVAHIKRMCPKGTKIGHLGTLDPMANGVLPIAIGRATRLFDLMQNKKKEYIAIFNFGKTTDSLDATGQLLKVCDKIPDCEEIMNTLPRFVGEISQIPPVFSAKNVNGVRAYQMARQGKPVNLTPCKVKIYAFELLEQLDSSTFSFRIECGSGTYIRSLCRDLALALGTVAVMTSLTRTKSGPFCLENAQNFDKLDLSQMISVEQALDFAKIVLSDIELKTLLDGKILTLAQPNGDYLAFNNDKLQCILTIKDNFVSNKIWLR